MKEIYIAIIPAFIASGINIVLVFYNVWYNKKNNSKVALDELINNKVNKEDCKSFKTRIGKESDSHNEEINELKECLSDIKENVAYIRGRME